MNNQFDELTKGLARSLTRKAALKKFGFGLAGITLAFLGLANKADAKPRPFRCHCDEQYYGCERYGSLFSDCIDYCGNTTDKGGCNGGAP
jgi:hypothetical protein